jgi:putative transposase
LEADFSLTGKRVAEVLNRAIALCGCPKTIQVDKRPSLRVGTREFAGKELDAWAYRRGIRLNFSRPGKPTDNPFVESFNGKFRDEFLDTCWFETLDGAKDALELWRREYNTERPHMSLGLKTPAEFATMWQAPQMENLRL